MNNVLHRVAPGFMCRKHTAPRRALCRDFLLSLIHILVALADCHSMALDGLVGRSSPVRTAPSACTADTESLLREEPSRDRFSTLKNGLIGLAAVLVPFAILLGLALKGGAWSIWALVIGGATGTVLLGRALYSGLSSLREGIARAWHELLDALR